MVGRYTCRWLVKLCFLVILMSKGEQVNDDLATSRVNWSKWEVGGASDL